MRHDDDDDEPVNLLRQTRDKPYKMWTPAGRDRDHERNGHLVFGEQAAGASPRSGERLNGM